jgi:hypothetical protein
VQTCCPKCKTIVRTTDGKSWTIMNQSCSDLAGTPEGDRPEYCPTLAYVFQADVELPGLKRVARTSDSEPTRSLLMSQGVSRVRG